MAAPVAVSRKRSAVLESRGGTRLIISMFLLSGDKQTIESEQELFNLCPGTVRSVFRTVVMKEKPAETAGLRRINE
ncbi:hypothetical protein IU399_23660 [Salmonella enterica subsp. enterica serovar Worthington]|nr:hypothetical protein [Salmonella enterica subsp. enterica serovar Worthington]MBP1524521.1 hypothetical protein [Salmonella enterica subsp. enterica serovar Worthington]